MDKNEIISDLNDEEIEMILKYMPQYTEDNAKNIRDKFRKKVIKKEKNRLLKKWMFGGVAASLVFISTLSYAGITDINSIYRNIFGEKSKYIQSHIESLRPSDNNIDNKEISSLTQSEYDGIIVKLVSAINDQDALRIFATVTDTKADRLGNELSFMNWGLSQGQGGNIEVVDYNDETRTATILITSLGGSHNGDATLKINGFSTGREFFENIPETNLDIHKLLKGHSPTIISQDKIWKSGGGGNYEDLYEKSCLLKYDEMDIPFESIDTFSISNMGFVDGLFHIQCKTMVDEKNLVDGIYMNLKFVDREDKVIYDPKMSIQFEADKKYAYEKYSKEPHYKYIEMIYPEIKSLEQVKNLFINLDYMKTAKVTEGSWELSFPIPEKITTDFKVDNRELNINGKNLRVNTVSLSPLGVVLELDQDISNNYGHSDIVYVEYDDGNIIELDQSSVQTYEFKSTLIFNGDLIEIEKVKKIFINGTEIEMNR